MGNIENLNYDNCQLKYMVVVNIVISIKLAVNIMQTPNVTGFMKTDHNVTRTEIQIIP